MALVSYTYADLALSDKLEINVFDIEITKKEHLFSKDEYIRTPKFYINNDALWEEFRNYYYRYREADLVPEVHPNIIDIIKDLSTTLSFYDYTRYVIKQVLTLEYELMLAVENPSGWPQFSDVDQDAHGHYALNEKAKAINKTFGLLQKWIKHYDKPIVPTIFDDKFVEKAEENYSGPEARQMLEHWRTVYKDVKTILVDTAITYLIRDFCVDRYTKRADAVWSKNKLSAIRDTTLIDNHDPYTYEQVNRLNTLFNVKSREEGVIPKLAKARHVFNAAIEAGDWETADSIYAPFKDMEDLTGSTDNEYFEYIWWVDKTIDRSDPYYNLPENAKNDMMLIWEDLDEALDAGIKKYPTDEGLVIRPTAKTLATTEDLLTYVNGYSMPHSEKLLTSQQQQIGNEAASRESNRQALDNARTTMQQEDTARQMEASKNYVTDTNAHVDDTIKLMATKSALSPSVPETVMVPGDEAMMYAAETMEQIENTNGNEPEMSEVEHEAMPSFPRNCGSGNVNSRQGMDTYANDMNAENDFTGAAEEAYIMAAYNVEFGSMEYWEAYEDYHRPPAEEEKKKKPTAMEKLGILASIGKDAAVKAAKNVGNAAMKAGTSLANTAGQLGSELLGATGDTLANVKDSIMNVSAESLFDKAMGVTKSLVCDSDGNFSLGKAIGSASNIHNIMQTKDPLNQMTKLSAFAGNTLGMPGLSKAVDMATKVKRNGFSVESAMEIGGSVTEKLGLTGEGKDTLFNRFSKDSLMDASLFRGAMDAVKSGNPQRLGDFLSSSKVENAFKNTDMPNMLFNNLTPSTSNCNGLAKLGSVFGIAPSTTKDLNGKLGDSIQPPPMSDAEHQATVAAIKSAAIDTRSYHSPGADKKMTAIGMNVDEAKMRSALANEFAVC